MEPPGRPLTLIRCSGCDSVFYQPPDIADFSGLDVDRETFWRFYVEVGGGVWETIWPILAAADRGSLLDVGCGFGYAIDFWQRTGRGEAVGVELADYGREGARRLDVTIHAERLEACAALAGRRFDVVYASEVIEHVPDPTAFVELLARWVADDGVLILTTPAASFIARENLSTGLLAALAPGFHGFLLSSQALADVARDAGFAHVETRTMNERQFAWASRRPLRLPKRLPPGQAPYLEYLAGCVAAPCDSASPVWQGFAYRLGKEHVSAGRLDEAGELLARLCGGIEMAFGADIIDPDTAPARLKQCATLVDFGRVAPFFLPSLFYHLGALAQHHQRQPRQALRYYAGAVECILEAGRIDALSLIEPLSLLWPARARQAELLLAAGDVAAGVDLFVRLAGEGARCDTRNAFAVAPRDLLEATVPAICEGLWSHGYRGRAQALFEAHAAYLTDRYGAAVTTAAGVESRLASGDSALPLDPMFAPFFLARAGIPAGDALAEATAIARIGELHADHAAYGRRLRELAARARALLAAAAGPTSASAGLVWSSGTSYRHRPR
ncbi:MAG TPA: class I SAM-dependent methyltransferase [Casimicrobiaceae bacterium]|nr:class I SAM-dependent methyltransferase [Casimicrobiaceae bacterium]